jgi:competence protein ComEC
MLRNLLRETIFVRICLAFILGIVLYDYAYAMLSSAYILSISIVQLLLLISYYFLLNRYGITFKIYNGIIVFSSILLFGFLYSYVHDNRNNTAYLAVQHDQTFILKIENIGKKKKHKSVYEASIIRDNKSITKVLLNMNQDQSNLNLKDVLLVRANLMAIPKANHPGAFNYKQYLAYKGIYQQFSIDSTAILKYYPASNRGIQGLSNSFKTTLIEILRSNIKDTSSFEMASALLLGERADIDQEIMQSYTDTGTIHIISVSGLHVGIIFLVLQWVFKLFFFSKNEMLKTVFIILFIWFYGLLTGLPASVIRSALMISFLSIGKAINIKSQSINHVAASALCIVSIDPKYAFDIGFQLSYLAVVGIIYLQKPIENLYQANTKFGKYIWVMVSVSIAAQLFTLPFCMYYFHQFPNYFLMANLIAIPLSSIALYAAIANLIFASVPILNTISEWCITYSIQYLNMYLQFIANIPGAVSRTEMWSYSDALLLCFFIFFMLLLLVEKIKSSLKFAIIVLIAWLGIHFYQSEKHNHPHLWLVQEAYQTYYSIEWADSIVHIYPSSTKREKIERNTQRWMQRSTKKQVLKMVDGKYFMLQIKNNLYATKATDIHYKSIPYKMVCL